jgi:hypothetical protein
MNLKTTLILLALLALGVGALMLTRGGEDDNTAGPKPTPGTTDTDARPIFDESDLGPALTRIGFVPGAGRTLVLERPAGRRWRVSPAQLPAEPRAIDEILTLLAELRGEAAPNDAPDLAPDAPRITLGKGEASITIRVGERLGGGRALVAVERYGADAERFVVQDTLQDVFEYFDATLLFGKSIDVPAMPTTRRVELNADGERSALVQDNNEWWIEHGESRERALESSLPRYPGVRDYFGLFDEIEIKSHVDPQEARNRAAFGLDRPLISVRFVPIDEPDAGWVFRVGVPADPIERTRYASYGPAGSDAHAVFTIPESQAIRLGQRATAFRDPRLITTPTALIASITTSTSTGDKHRFNFDTDAPALSLDERPAVALEKQAAATIITALYDARAIAYVEQLPTGSDRLASIRIEARLNGPSESLTLYSDPEADQDTPTVLARRGEETVLLRVERSVVEALLEPDNLFASE